MAIDIFKPIGSFFGKLGSILNPPENQLPIYRLPDILKQQGVTKEQISSLFPEQFPTPEDVPEDQQLRTQLADYLQSKLEEEQAKSKVQFGLLGALSPYFFSREGPDYRFFQPSDLFSLSLSAGDVVSQARKVLPPKELEESISTLLGGKSDLSAARYMLDVAKFGYEQDRDIRKEWRDYLEKFEKIGTVSDSRIMLLNFNNGYDALFNPTSLKNEYALKDWLEANSPLSKQSILWSSADGVVAILKAKPTPEAAEAISTYGMSQAIQGGWSLSAKVVETGTREEKEVLIPAGQWNLGTFKLLSTLYMAVSDNGKDVKKADEFFQALAGGTDKPLYKVYELVKDTASNPAKITDKQIGEALKDYLLYGQEINVDLLKKAINSIPGLLEKLRDAYIDGVLSNSEQVLINRDFMRNKAHEATMKKLEPLKPIGQKERDDITNTFGSDPIAAMDLLNDALEKTWNVYFNRLEEGSVGNYPPRLFESYASQELNSLFRDLISTNSPYLGSALRQLEVHPRLKQYVDPNILDYAYTKLLANYFELYRIGELPNPDDKEKKEKLRLLYLPDKESNLILPDKQTGQLRKIKFNELPDYFDEISRLSVNEKEALLRELYKHGVLNPQLVRDTVYADNLTYVLNIDKERIMKELGPGYERSIASPTYTAMFNWKFARGRTGGAFYPFPSLKKFQTMKEYSSTTTTTPTSTTPSTTNPPTGGQPTNKGTGEDEEIKPPEGIYKRELK